MRIGIGLGLDRDAAKAARDAVAQAKRAVPEPQLALAFGGVTCDQQAVHAALASVLDPTILFGGSSYAEITPAGVTKGSVAVLLLSFEDGAARVGGGAVGKDSAETLANLTGPFVGAAARRRLPLGLFFTSIDGSYDDAFLSGIARELGGVPVFGGITATNYDLGMSHPEFWKNYQYSGARLTRDEARIALLDLPQEGFKFAFGFESGWDPVAPPVTITRAEKELVYEVDGVPVVEWYRQFIGREQSPEFFELMVQRYAFALEVADGAQQVLKLPVKVDFDAGWIRFIPSEDMRGKKVRLIQASRRGAVDGARRAAERCRDALDGWKPELLLVVSCCTRNMVLHSRLEAELDAVRGVFGPDVPVFGYYSGGEILPFLSRYEDVVDPAKRLGGSRYHAGTIGVLALGAKAGPAAVSVPERIVRFEDPAARAERLHGMLSTSEQILDDTETFLRNLSRKSFLDGERIQKQAEIIHRYTPHDVWEAVAAGVERGEDDLYDAEFEGAFLFLDVKGFTAYSEKHGSEEVVKVLNEIFEPTTEIIYRFGGDVDKFIGDCIFAAFRDKRAALDAGRAVLEMFRELKRRGNPFEVRVGVNAGRAVRANVGTRSRREYTFIGDAVNTAQRLESNCTPGRMLISENLYDLVRSEFPEAERRMIAAKGKTAPVTAFEL